MVDSGEHTLQCGNVAITFRAGSLIEQPVQALLVASNNQLRPDLRRWSWALEVQQRAGQAHVAECQARVRAAGEAGFAPGQATITGAGLLAAAGPCRWVLHDITTGAQERDRTPATPDVVYGAVRRALELAEVFHVSRVATYPMAGWPGDVAPAPALLEALCRAVAGHAAISGALQRIIICDQDAGHLDLAAQNMARILQRSLL